MPPKKKNAAAAGPNLSHQIQGFLDSSSPPETLRQQAGVWLNNKDLARTVLGFSKEDRRKFVDKVDQVR
jgi:hypothetical protein